MNLPESSKVWPSAEISGSNPRALDEVVGLNPTMSACFLGSLRCLAISFFRIENKT